MISLAMLRQLAWRGSSIRHPQAAHRLMARSRSPLRPHQMLAKRLKREYIFDMKNEAKRGGARRGSGRKPLSEESQTVPVVTRMTTAQRDKLQRLGGAPWVRDRIDKAKEPTPKE